MEKRGWYCRLNPYEYGPFRTEREALSFGERHRYHNLQLHFSTYYGHFFNYKKHKHD